MATASEINVKYHKHHYRLDDPIVIDAIALLLGKGVDFEEEKRLIQSLLAPEHKPCIPANVVKHEANRISILFPYVSACMHHRKLGHGWETEFLWQPFLRDVSGGSEAAGCFLDGWLVAEKGSAWYPVAFFEAKGNEDEHRTEAQFRAEGIFVMNHSGDHILPILGVRLNFTQAAVVAKLSCFN